MGGSERGKKVFIFGAGASRAAQDAQRAKQQEDHRAPLANDLFGPAYQDAAYRVLDGADFKRCGQGCADAIRDGGNLESWLTKRWESVPSFGPQKQHAEKAFFGRVCFYLWRLLQRVSDTYQGANGNTYYRLMRKLIDSDEDFALISFNYDTFLDRAVKEVHGATLESVDSYLNVPLIKPHGSVNWLLERDSDSGYRAEEKPDDAAWLARASARMFNGGEFNVKDWTVVDPTHMALREISELRQTRRRYFYPLLFMPVTTKWNETVVGFHSTMIERAQQEISDASAVYVVGYSASDDVFAQIVDSARAGTSLYVVGHGDGVDQIADRIVKKHSQLHLEKAHPVGFQDFVQGWL